MKIIQWVQKEKQNKIFYNEAPIFGSTIIKKVMYIKKYI